MLVCYIENSVLFYETKLSQRQWISVWFCRFGVFLLLSETVTRKDLVCKQLIKTVIDAVIEFVCDQHLSHVWEPELLK